MRITQAIRSDAFAGVERYVADVSNGLSDLGHEVVVIGGHPERMRSELSAQVRWCGARTTREVAQLLLKGGRQDIVHLHMTAAEFAGVVTRPFHGAALVTTRHFAAPRGSSPAPRIAGSLISKSMAAQISISRFVSAAITEPSVVIYSGVRPQPRVTTPRDRVVLCLTRLESEKAPDIAVKAWASSEVAKDGWELHIAGSGAERPHLEELTARLGVQGSVRFLGYISDTAQPLRRAALLLATTPAEGFGLSVVEAMAHGTPVLTTASGAHPEILGEDGWTFPPGDSTAAATLLRRFTSLAQDDREEIGERLRQRQRSLFDLERHVQALHNLYSAIQRGESPADSRSDGWRSYGTS